MTQLTYYRILVTGSRRFTDVQALEAALLDTWHDVTQLGGQMLVVHGECYPPPDASGQRPYQSADWLTHLWCAANGVQDEPHPADWHTPAAPPDRSATPRWSPSAPTCASPPPSAPAPAPATAHAEPTPPESPSTR